MTSQPPRNRGRWSLDFTRGGRNSTSSTDLPNPPGYSASITSIHDPSRQNDSSLRAKRLWDMALGPIKQVPMNLFIMYMSGNAISIFPIMMVIMMAVRPFKTLFSINSTFKALDANESSLANLGQKLVYVLGNLVGIALAVYKCQSMGLLPTHASDWLAFADPVLRAEWAYA